MDAGEDTHGAVRSRFVRTYEAGQSLFHEGDEDDTFYVIQSGEIELSRMGPAGRRVVARLGAGDFFGEMSVVLGEPRTVRAVARTTVRVLELDGETLEGMCTERPEVALRIIHRLATRLIEAERRFDALGLGDLRQPVVQALVRCGVPEGQSARIPLKLRDIAREAGVPMLESSRVLQQLLERQLVVLEDEVLRAPDVDALAASVDALARSERVC